MLLNKFKQPRNNDLSKKNGLEYSRNKMKSSKLNKSVGMQRLKPTTCVTPKPVNYAA
jgi:hypothetical protein